MRFQHAAIAAIGALACAVLVGESLTPSWAAGHSAHGDRDSVVVGEFALGDGLEGLVSERDGAFALTLPVGGIALRWDSRSGGGAGAAGAGGAGARDSGSGRYGLGPWSLGFGEIGTTGGIEVHPASAGGSYAPDPTQPSGLAGYGLDDVVFEQTPGALPARLPVDGGPGHLPIHETEYAYLLHELGGSTTYFSPAGDPIANLDANDLRTDWVWDDLVPHRLLGLIDADGVITELDWESEPGTVVVRPGVNLGDHDAGTAWRIELDGGRVTGVTNPLGGRVSVDYDDETGLVSAITGVTGATTQLAWRAWPDGVTRVDRVRTVDAVGAELSVREWRPADDRTLPSGWPAYAGESDLFWSGDPAFRYQTVVTDGSTRVISEYNSVHALVDRRMVVTTASGDAELQQHAFTYPGTEDGGVPDPAALPESWSRPTRTELTVRDARGGSRTSVETFASDAYGRTVQHAAADGSVTETEFDSEVPEHRPVPVGLPLVETLRAPDGQSRTTRHTLNRERTAVVASEVTTSVAADAPGLVTARHEFEVRADGVLLERREYPGGDRAAEPSVTRWAEATDLATGTRSRTETIGVGTPAAASTTEVTSLRHGGVLEATDAVGVTVRTEFDVIGRPVAVRDRAERVTTSEYETAQSHGRNATVVATPDGVVRTQERDALDRVTREIDNVRAGAPHPGHERVIEAREYPEPGVVEITDAWGATTVSRQDVFGRPVETIAPNGMHQLTVHDDVANTVTTGLTPTGDLRDADQTRTETRDLAGRTTQTAGERRDARPVPATTTEYDGWGRALVESDGAVHTANELDVHGNPVTSELSPLDDATTAMAATRRFDQRGNSLEKTLHAVGESRSGGERIVDALGRTVSATDQLGRVTEFEYTLDGLLASAVTRGGQTIEHEYDPVTRAAVRTSVASPVGTSVITAYDYDPGTDRLASVFDPGDRAGTEIAYEYDVLGNRTRIAHPDGKVLRFRYDDHGRRLGVVDAAGSATEYRYDAVGQLVGAEQTDAGGATLADVSYEYDAFGRVTALRYGNGVETTYTFSSASEIRTELTTADGGPLSFREYEYDERGNVVSRSETFDVEPGSRDADAHTVTTSYAYDAYDRLVRSTERRGVGEGAAVRETTYALTVSGDIASETVVTRTGAGETSADAATEATTERAFEYNAIGELDAVVTTPGGPGAGDEVVVRRAQSYDDAGNLTRGFDGTAYTYDAANRPATQVDPNGELTQIAYWADGSRRSLGTGAALTEFYWDDTTLVNDAHRAEAAAETGVASYLLGAGRHSRSTITTAGETSTEYSTVDRHGSVTDVTDEAGALRARHAHTDYGVPVPHAFGPVPDPVAGLARNPFGYAGEYTDPIGTQHLRARSYDAETMRFTTMDTAELHNLYAYADLNPITNVDPSGRAAEADTILNWVTIGLAVLSLVGMAFAATVAAPVAAAAAAVAEWTLSSILTAAAVTTSITSDVAGLLFASIRIDDPEWLTKELDNDLTWLESVVGFGAFGIGMGARAAVETGRKAYYGLRRFVFDHRIGWSTPPLTPAMKETLYRNEVIGLVNVLDYRWAPSRGAWGAGEELLRYRVEIDPTSKAYGHWSAAAQAYGELSGWAQVARSGKGSISDEKTFSAIARAVFEYRYSSAAAAKAVSDDGIAWASKGVNSIVLDEFDLFVATPNMQVPLGLEALQHDWAAKKAAAVAKWK